MLIKAQIEADILSYKETIDLITGLRGLDNQALLDTYNLFICNRVMQLENKEYIEIGENGERIYKGGK